MRIQAIILDGFHKGHSVSMDYMPTIRLIKPRTVTVDYCCGGDEIPDTIKEEYEEYKACFHGVDRDVVLYSKEGKSGNFLSWFNHSVSSKECWDENTVLYFGYHNEPIRVKQDGTQETEFERGKRIGFEDGRIFEAKQKIK